EHARELWHAEIADPEAVEPKGLDRETPDRVEADVAKEERAGILTQPWPKPRHERHEDGEGPQRLVEERRGGELELPEAGGTVRRGDVELAGHGGGPAERLRVEEVPPAPDRLAEHHRRSRDVETAQNRHVPLPREEDADERSHDQPAVHREPALPHRGNLPRVCAVVVPVENHLVD